MTRTAATTAPRLIPSPMAVTDTVVAGREMRYSAAQVMPAPLPIVGGLHAVVRMLALPLPPIPTPVHRETPELLDALTDIPADALAHNLRDIRRVNRYFGGTAVVCAHLPSLLGGIPEGATVSVLDTATGSGDIPRALVRWGRQHGYDVRVVATDVADDVLAVARRETTDEARIAVEACDVRALPYRDDTFDIVICSLALHHLNRTDAVRALAEMGRVARQGIIVNDLVRSWAGYVGARLLGALTTTNRLTRHDAPLSVLRAWTPDELRAMANEAGLRRATVTPHLFSRQALVAYGTPT